MTSAPFALDVGSLSVVAATLVTRRIGFSDPFYLLRATLASIADDF
jgi:hypothetical protein